MMCGKLIVVLVLVLVVESYVYSLKRSNKEHIYDVALDGGSTIHMHWLIDYDSKKINFEIHLPSGFGWFALGFSDRGALYPADYCLLWYDWKRHVFLQDTSANEQGVLELDKNQHCKDFKIKVVQNITKYTYSRAFDTCDPHDYIIEDGTTHVVWSRGKSTLYKATGLNISTSSQANDHGMVRVTLLKNTRVNENIPLHAEPFDIVTNRVRVPTDETTYWCKVFKLPKRFRKKHHIYKYESAIEKHSEGVVHHMEVFHCEASPNEEIPLYDGDCFASERPKSTQVCKRVLAAWAMGAPPFVYPEEAGLPIGGEHFNPYLMLEVHYNNPEHQAGIVDSSGIRIYTSNHLRKLDAGIIELGLEYTDKMAIPPKQTEFPLTGYCVSECTAVSLPPEGILVFGSQLHTHLTGVRVYTRHFRNGRELPELNRDNHFSTHFQEIRRLKRQVKILPGDALLTTCGYNTEERDNITLGGFAITDEMCVNYIHYYPATSLEVCKSAISDQALSTFFRYMKEWEDQNISTSQGISASYRAIKWNPMRVQLLQDIYGEAPLSMQCNMSSGDRFPGYWENTPLSPILLPLPPAPRQCHNAME